MPSATQTKDTPPTPLTRYQDLIAAGTLRHDTAQERCMQALDELCIQLRETTPSLPSGKISLFNRLRGKPAEGNPNGIYLYGDVGRGKSMLMDIFYQSLQRRQKRRIHFHAFMLDVHRRMHAWRQVDRDDDLIARVVGELVEEFDVLCLDEFQVTDVTDALILARLFASLFDAGITVVITSNRAPDELYQGGLQRDQFLKFVDLAKQRMQVLNLDSDTDYRLQQLKAMKNTYMSPLGLEADECFYDTYIQLTQGAPSQPVAMNVNGRRVTILKACGDVAWVTFDEVCERPLGPADYLEMASIFHTVMLQNIPQMGPEKRNEAKRFVTLIDALYDHRVKLIASAAVPPEQLYPEGDFSFEFQRTVSRLHEMQSERYMAECHIL